MDKADKRQRWQRLDNLVGTQIEDSYVVLGPDLANFFAFNPTAKTVWDMLENPVSVEAVAAALTQDYDVPLPDATASVERLLGDLDARGLVRRLSAPDGDI